MLHIFKKFRITLTALICATFTSMAHADTEQAVFKETKLLTNACMTAIFVKKSDFSELLKHGYTKSNNRNFYKKKLEGRQSLLGKPLIGIGDKETGRFHRCSFAISFLANHTATNLVKVVTSVLQKAGYKETKHKALARVFVKGSTKLTVKSSALYGTHAHVEIKLLK